MKTKKVLSEFSFSFLSLAKYRS
jgi:hypothetical protein